METLLTFKNSALSLRMIRAKKYVAIQYFSTIHHRYCDYLRFHPNEYVTCYQQFQFVVADAITSELFNSLKDDKNEKCQS